MVKTSIIVLTLNQKRSLRELRADFYTCHCWPCDNMPLNMMSLCCYTSSCSDTLSDMCKSLIPTGYSGLALLSCKPTSERSLLSPIYYFRAAGDTGLQSEPFSKQTSHSWLFSSAAIGCQMWVGEARSSAFCFDQTENTSTHPHCVVSSLSSGRDHR